MPNTKHRKKSQQKADAQNLRNRAKRTRMRSAVRSARDLIATDASGATPAVTAATSEVDRAASQGIIHKNKAARLKSRLAKAQNRAAAGS